ncbi:MAG: cytochrome P450 [Kineosporiaceae bacterium]
MTAPTAVPLDQIDLTNLDAFRDNLGWGQFDTLRREDPLHWSEEPAPNKGFWSVTRYADIATVDGDPDTFTSSRFVNLEEVDDDLMDARRSILETDGARHAALRKLVQREFSPRNLRQYEDFLRQLTKVTVDEALSTPEFDFVQKISADFPIQVLARLLDVPKEHTGQLIAWGNEFVGNTDPDYTKFRADLPESDKYKHLPFRSPTVQEVWDYGNDLKAKRTGGDGTDLISILANRMPEDGIPLSQKDFENYFTLLVIAGNETTRHSISHAMLALINHPEQLRYLQEDPSRIAGALEELLRWASPVYHFRRTATRDVELHGKTIREGDKVVMWFASGNRDEDVFPDPYTLDVTRTNVDHMTFGKTSPHLCLGNNLARMEIRLMFEELLPRLGSIELAGEVKRVRSNFVNGIKKFPVRVTAA